MKWKLGVVSGIGIYVHWSFWLLPAWVLFTGSAGSLAGALAAIGFVFAIFGCVVLHELGHALMARRFDVGTRDITLYPIGGVARLERIPTRPSQELAIALAGPAVNVVIAGVLLVVLLALGFGSEGVVFSLTPAAFLASLFAVNVALVVFNMLPAFPMDGGRVLRAFLAMWLPYDRATEIAVRVGQAVAIALGVIGLFSSPTLILIAVFVFLAAQGELMSVRNRFARQSWSYDVHPSASGGSPAPNALSQSEIYWVDRSSDDGIHIIRVREH